MSPREHSPVKAELDRLTMKFLQAVSFEPGKSPSYASIAALFIERGLLIKNVGSAPEISSVQEFIAPREALVSSGTLTRFHESEILGNRIAWHSLAAAYLRWHGSAFPSHQKKQQAVPAIAASQLSNASFSRPSAPGSDRAVTTCLG